MPEGQMGRRAATLSGHPAGLLNKEGFSSGGNVRDSQAACGHGVVEGVPCHPLRPKPRAAPKEGTGGGGNGAGRRGWQWYGLCQVVEAAEKKCFEDVSVLPQGCE